MKIGQLDQLPRSQLRLGLQWCAARRLRCRRIDSVIYAQFQFISMRIS